MNNNSVAKLWAIGIQFVILIASPGLSRTQSPTPQVVQPSASSPTQGDPYADAFAGLSYTEGQKGAINKITKDIASRKAAVMNDDKLTNGQKNAMLTGYTRIEYNLIYKELTVDQKKQVSTRMHAVPASEQAARKSQAPAR